MVSTSWTRTTASSAVRTRTASTRTAGSAASPMSSSLVSRPSRTATTASSAPMTIELSASQTFDPVTWWAIVPASATRTPRTAMLSSLATVLTVGSGLRTT